MTDTPCTHVKYYNITTPFAGVRCAVTEQFHFEIALGSKRIFTVSRIFYQSGGLVNFGIMAG